MENHDQIKLLEALVIDNPELERLESLLDQFNIFEALGAVRVELRHSDFLAFLLTPSQSHGLGDAFVKRFLQSALKLASEEQTTIRPIDLDLWDLDGIFVLREWQNIDILLTDETNQFFVVIENKIGSTEHSNQLIRYRQIADQQYKGWHSVYLFLTPEGEEASDPSYISIDYDLIANLVEQFVETRASTLGPDVMILLNHYSQMLRRYIVSGSEIENLCREIYRKHQRALDLIYEYRPDLQVAISEYLQQIIPRYPDFILDRSSKTYIRFVRKSWDVPVLLKGHGWTDSGRILLFEIANHPNRLKLNLLIGPGPEETRQKLFNMALENRPLFRPAYKALGKLFNTIYQKSILTSKSLEDASMEDLEPEIISKWEHFLQHDLPEIQAVLDKQAWIWKET